VDRTFPASERPFRPTPGNVTNPQPQVPGTPGSPIAGSVLPLQRAEELIASLQDVVSVRITSTESGSVDAIHVLVTGETAPKQVVRNIESALMAQLGLRVDHRKISIAATSKGAKAPAATAEPVPVAAPVKAGREVYFEDVELRGSRVRGVTCKVTLRIGAEQFAGEAEEGLQSDRSRVEVAARAAVMALSMAGPPVAGLFSLEGARVIQAFEREFVFAAVMARQGREQVLLTGSCEVRDSAETAAVLAVLDATNRWMGPAVQQAFAAALGTAEDRRQGR